MKTQRENLAWCLIELAYGAAGGCTLPVDPFGKLPKTGYCVARGEGTGLTMLTTSVTDRVNQQMVAEWLAQRPANFAEYVGSWRDGHVIHYDYVDIVDNPRLALDLAYERGEKALFDLVAGKVVRVV